MLNNSNVKPPQTGVCGGLEGIFSQPERRGRERTESRDVWLKHLVSAAERLTHVLPGGEALSDPADAQFERRRRATSRPPRPRSAVAPGAGMMVVMKFSPSSQPSFEVS